MIKPLSFFILLSLFLFSGCATVPDEQTRQKSSETAYEQAMSAAGSGEYAQAMSELEAIIESKASDQEKDRARIGMGFVLYKQGDYHNANSVLTRFYEERSTAAQMPYFFYLRGLSRLGQGKLEYQEYMGRVNLDGSYPTELRAAYEDFATLITQFADSPYRRDAIVKTNEIRDKLARFEIHAAKSELIQGNYQEVLNRARYIDEYYSSPEIQREAVKLMKKAYIAIGEDARAEQMEQRLQAIQPSLQ